MPFKTTNEAGEEVEAYTKDELDAIAAEKDGIIQDKEKHLEKKTQELAQLRGVNKRLSDMSEDEKSKYTAVELELKKKQEEIEDYQRKEHTGKRNNILDKLAAGNADLRKKAEEHYGLLNLPEGNEEEMLRRAQYALSNASLDLGLSQQDTLGRSFSHIGEAPKFGSPDGKSFAETEKGKSAEEAIFGDILDPNKQ